MKRTQLPYPSEWMQLLTPFGSCFTNPQFGNFCQLTTAMVVSQYASVCRWAGLFAPKHQSSLNDFLNSSPWDDSLVRDRLRRLTVRRIHDIHIGIIDDTLSHHPYAVKMAHVGWYYDGLTKTEQKGHSIVTHGLHSRELGFVPFDLELYKKDGRSKNDIACAMIARTQRHARVPLYVVDSWYSNRHVLGTVRAHGAHYVTEIKSNRNVTIDNKCRYVREHERHLPVKRWTEARVNGDTYRYFQTSAFIHSLGSVNLVFSQKHDEKTGTWSETYSLITDLLKLPGERVIELFVLRGGIEGFHREAKQQLGLEHYHLRNARGIERYLFLVLLAFVLLLLLGQRLLRKTFARKTIGELREHVKAACFTMLLHTAPRLTKEHIETTARALAYAL